MPSFLTEVKGFTLLLDVVVEELGYMHALVYGIIWRYCQMSEQVCYASLGTLAAKLDMSERTVHRKIKDLIVAEYIIDKTPKRRNRPHHYVTTDKASIIGLLEVRVKENGLTESQAGTTESQAGTTESQAGTDTESVEETKKILPKKPSKKEGETPTPDPPPRKPKRPIAVETFREAVHRYPAKSWWQKIDETVGRDESSLGRWYSVCHAWVGMGWNPTNVKGMLEFFERGEIPGTKGKATPRRPIGRVVSQEEREAWWAAEDELTKSLGRPPSSEEIKAHLEQQGAVQVAKGRL